MPVLDSVFAKHADIAAPRDRTALVRCCCCWCWFLFSIFDIYSRDFLRFLLQRSQRRPPKKRYDDDFESRRTQNTHTHTYIQNFSSNSLYGNTHSIDDRHGAAQRPQLECQERQQAYSFVDFFVFCMDEVNIVVAHTQHSATAATATMQARSKRTSACFVRLSFFFFFFFFVYVSLNRIGTFGDSAYDDAFDDATDDVPAIASSSSAIAYVRDS
jgi:hypothetical protein